MITSAQPQRSSMFSKVTQQYRLNPLPPKPWGSNVIQVNPIQYYRPHEKQVLALKCPSGEIFFGGAKGGGKTLCLLLAFARQERKYGRHARGIIFRRTQPEFADLKNKAEELFRGHAEWRGGDLRAYVFKSGATLRLAHLDTVQDVGRYTGNEYTFIAFDELTEWVSGDAYAFMKTCLRSVHGVPGLIMSSGNPGRPGAAWVKNRFILPMPPMTVYYGPQMPRVFIPSRLDDNPYLLKDAQYERTLREQEDPTLVKALRWGQWDVTFGAAFPEWDDRRHTYDPRDSRFQLHPSYPRWAALDWGQKTPYCVGFYCGMPNGRIVKYRESYGNGGEEGDNIGTNEPPNRVAERERSLTGGEFLQGIVMDTNTNSPSTAGFEGETVRQMWERAGWVCHGAQKGPGSRLEGKRAIHRGLSTNLDDGLPAFMISRDCRNTVRTFPGLQYNERTKGKEEDVDDSGEDHSYDETRYSLMSAFARNVYMMAGHNQVVTGAERRIVTLNHGLGYDPNADLAFAEQASRSDTAAFDPNDDFDTSWSDYLE